MAGATRFMPLELGFKSVSWKVESDVEVKCEAHGLTCTNNGGQVIVVQKSCMN